MWNKAVCGGAALSVGPRPVSGCVLAACERPGGRTSSVIPVQSCCRPSGEVGGMIIWNSVELESRVRPGLHGGGTHTSQAAGSTQAPCASRGHVSSVAGDAPAELVQRGGAAVAAWLRCRGFARGVGHWRQHSRLSWWRADRCRCRASASSPSASRGNAARLSRAADGSHTAPAASR